MSTLAHLQTAFQHYVLHHEGSASTALDAIAPAIASDSRLAAHERLAIYHRAYRGRLEEALSTAYEQTWTYVGDAMFADLAQSYVAAHPSHNPNLRWFGNRFAQYAALALPDNPQVAELAALEWALGLAFDAADATPFGAEDLACVPPEEVGGLVLRLHPSAQLLPLAWNTITIWSALKDHKTPPAAALSSSAICWLVWRTDNQPHFRSLDAAEAHALQSLAHGASLESVFATAADDEDAITRMAGYLQNWLHQCLLTGAAAATEQ